MTWEEFLDLVELVIQYELSIDDLDELIPTLRFANFCEDAMGLEACGDIVPELQGIRSMYRSQNEGENNGT